jgi:hypothetical protein
MRFTAEALDAKERGEVELPEGHVKLFRKVRELLARWL